MMLTFHVDATGLDVVIPGPHEDLVVAAPAVPKKVTHFFGVIGTSVIVGQPSLRELLVDMWLSDPQFTDIADLYTELGNLDANLVGQTGHLIVSDDAYGYWPANQNTIFYDVLLDGYTPLPLAGQRTPSPVRDTAGSLYRSGTHAGVKSWFLRLQLRFLQALPGRVVT